MALSLLAFGKPLLFCGEILMSDQAHFTNSLVYILVGRCVWRETKKKKNETPAWKKREQQENLGEERGAAAGTALDDPTSS